MRGWPTVNLGDVLRAPGARVRNALSRRTGGATGNSPAFQRWVKAFEIEKSPVGTAELRDIAWKTAHHFNRPSGTRFPFPPIPTVETEGYCRASLRDWGGVNSALPDRGSVSRSALREMDALDPKASVAGGVAAGHGPALRSHGGPG